MQHFTTRSKLSLTRKVFVPSFSRKLLSTTINSNSQNRNSSPSAFLGFAIAVGSLLSLFLSQNEVSNDSSKKHLPHNHETYVTSPAYHDFPKYHNLTCGEFAKEIEKKYPMDKLPIVKDEKQFLSFAPAVPPPVSRHHSARIVVNMESVKKRLPLDLTDDYEFWTFNGSIPGELLLSSFFFLSLFLCLFLRLTFASLPGW
jgi:hypothetical protein